MAQFNHQKKISGLLGNVVFMERYGKQFLRSRPIKMNQTAATKKSATEFGQCSHWSKQLRKVVLPFLQGLTDSRMYQRFTACWYNALLSNTTLPKGTRTPLTADMSGVNGFEFNLHAPLSHYCPLAMNAQLTALRQVEVRIPAMHTTTDIRFPEGATGVELWLYMHATNFDSNASTIDADYNITIAASEEMTPETVWTGPVLPENYFVMVTAKLVYFKSNRFTIRQYLNHKMLNPARVLLASKTGE